MGLTWQAAGHGAMLELEGSAPAEPRPSWSWALHHMRRDTVIPPYISDPINMKSAPCGTPFMT